MKLPTAAGWTLWPLALSWDGQHVVLQAGRLDGQAAGLVLYTLASGAQRLYPMPGGMTHDVALSPDGRTMAALDAGDESSVILVDLDTGTERRLWAGDGIASAVSWSPDGRHIAVSCEVDDRLSSNTTVINAVTGAVAAQYAGMETLRSPNGCWISDGELAILPFDNGDGPGPFFAADVDTGAIRQYTNRPPEWTGGCHAILDRRVIQSFWHKGYYLTGLDGSDPSLLLSTAAGREVVVADVAPHGLM